MNPLDGLPERFARRVTVQTDGCWTWSSTNSRGYGSYQADDGTWWLAHRFAYAALVGPIPDGLTIDHLCRVTRCVNPAHLEAVTMRENVLRGEGPAARNALKTHCDSGHPFDETNTYVAANGRQCRRCQARRQREYYSRQRVAA